MNKKLFEMTEKFSSKNINLISRKCAPLFNFLPINFFWFQFHSKDGKFNCIGNNPDLMLHFYEEKMYLDTPFFVTPEWIVPGIYLVNDIERQKYHENWNCLEKKFNSRHLFSFTKHDGERCYEYGFSARCNEKTSSSLIINQIPLINAFIDYFETEFSHIIQEMVNNPIDLNKELKLKFYQEKNSQIPYDLNKEQKLKFLKQIDKNFNQSILFTEFTPREKEVIALYYKGIPAREVANKLKLSNRTVEFYIENIKNKLSCTSKTELFACLHQLNKIYNFENLK